MLIHDCSCIYVLHVPKLYEDQCLLFLNLQSDWWVASHVGPWQKQLGGGWKVPVAPTFSAPGGKDRSGMFLHEVLGQHLHGFKMFQVRLWWLFISYSKPDETRLFHDFDAGSHVKQLTPGLLKITHLLPRFLLTILQLFLSLLWLFNLPNLAWKRSKLRNLLSPAIRPCSHAKFLRP